MRQKVTLLIGMIFTVALLAAGCGAAGKTGESPSDKEDQNSTEGVKTGLGIITDISGSKDASAEKEGTAAADITIAAVTVDEKGRIVECVIDAQQTKISIDAAGKITTDLAAKFPSKQELGDDYKMKGLPPSKEWNEQADAFAAYCVGKTVDEITGIAMTAEGTAADLDLTASCTIHIGSLQAAVIEAVQNAE